MEEKTVKDLFGTALPKVVQTKLNTVQVCSNPDLICGVELEIEDLHDDNYETAISMKQDIWKVDRDGSLRPQDYSFEFISKPMKMNGLLAELEGFFEKFKFSDKNYSDRTSVHVHTNVTDFTMGQLNSLCLVYPIVESVLFEFINMQGAKDPYGYSRDTNLYCIPWTHCRLNQEFIQKFLDNPVDAARRWQKYTALNLVPISSIGTVEWRHLHGTNDMGKIRQWLNLIGSIMQYVKTRSPEDVTKTVQQLNDNSAYQIFFYEVLGHYLDYNPRYQETMAEGVINAKYALINKGKKVEKKSLYAGLLEGLDAPDVQADDVLADALRRTREQTARWDAVATAAVRGANTAGEVPAPRFTNTRVRNPVQVAVPPAGQPAPQPAQHRRDPRTGRMAVNPAYVQWERDEIRRQQGIAAAQAAINANNAFQVNWGDQE